MRSFLEYFDNSVSSRVSRALEHFVEGREGLLEELGMDSRRAFNYMIEPFKQLTYYGADRPALEDLLGRIEKLAVKLNSGQQLYEALIDLMHMADNLDENWHYRDRFSLVSEIDRIRASRF